MADNGSFPDISIFSKLTASTLTYHLFNRSFCPFHIVRCMRKFLCQIRFHIFEIRKINIHISFQQFQCFQFFITTGIIHYRKIHSLHSCKIQCLYNLRYIMCTCHQIDIGSTFFFQFQKNFSKPFHTYCQSSASNSNIMILAETTTQPASGKEHRSGTFCSGNAGFLPHMQCCSCQINGPIHPAETFFPGTTVHMAFSRTECTGGHHFSGYAIYAFFVLHVTFS